MWPAHVSFLSCFLAPWNETCENQPPQQRYQSTARSWRKLIKLSDNIFCDHCGNQIPPWQIMLVIVRPLKCNAATGSYPLRYIIHAEHHESSVSLQGTQHSEESSPSSGGLKGPRLSAERVSDCSLLTAWGRRACNQTASEHAKQVVASWKLWDTG